MSMNQNKIPAALRERPQWVLWRTSNRGGKPTKIPCQCNGSPASSTDPATWATFGDVCERYDRGGYDGIGYVFAADDPFVGIDLDGCRTPETGELAEWAREIVLSLATYSEVSPSRTGVKLFARGKLPFATGKKKELDKPRVADKSPAIELYDHGRYFAVTGWALKGLAIEPEERQSQIEEVINLHFAAEPQTTGSNPQPDFRGDAAVLDRARKYLAKMPPAVSGSGGHNATFHAACVLVLGFELSQPDAMTLLREWNASCVPPWSDREIEHKLQSAAKQPGQRGYLRNATPERWANISVPTYTETEQREPRVTTLAAAALAYLDSIRDGQSPLIETGFPDLDYAVGGGFERGELVTMGARPSHGKSAVALQMLHTWTGAGMPCAIVSEEMSALALGKRTVQYATPLPQESWAVMSRQLRAEIEQYGETHAPCFVLEGCGDTDTAIRAIDRAVERDGIQAIAVDYAQLLRGKGKTLYEQLTQVSMTLRSLATRHKLIVLALAQLSREIEQRGEFKPQMSDLKGSGQFEQDSDVIFFGVWPWRIDATCDPTRYQFFVEKNRNRAINQRGVDCRFNAARQMFSMPVPEYCDHAREWQT